MDGLKFGNGNAKLRQGIATFSLPSGYTCPFAEKCLSKAVKGKIKDGPKTEFRCFSASEEVTFPNVYRARQHNLAILRQCENDIISMVHILSLSLPKFFTHCRIHVSGDFFSHNYFLAWIKIATLYPHITFYAYTKSLSYWIAERTRNAPPYGISRKVNNLRLTASYGGKQDSLIAEHNLRSAKVVFSEQESMGLPIDHDDSHAYGTGGNFALLLHGIQPANTVAQLALRKLQASGITGYGRDNNTHSNLVSATNQ